MRRVLRVVVALLAGAFVLLIAALNLGAYVISARDGEMRAYASDTVTDSAGRTIRYFESGRPDARWTIIFIHGTPADAGVFAEQFRDPFPNANLLALDRPGFGASKPARTHPSLDDQAEAIKSLLPETPGRTILVGHSYGGPVALLAALKFTNQITGVVLIGGSLDPAQEHPWTIQHVADWPVFSWLLPRPLRQCNRELLTLRGDLVDLKARLPALTVPVVMLHGTRDHQVPVANFDYLRNQLAAAGKTNLLIPMIMPGYNHFIPWQHPDAVKIALQNLTDRIENHDQNR